MEVKIYKEVKASVLVGEDRYDEFKEITLNFLAIFKVN